MARRSFFGTLRLVLLLAVLLFVATGAWLDRARSTAWDRTLRVTVYPIAAVPDDATQRYVAGLDETSFGAVDDFLQVQARRYGVGLDEPVRIRVSHFVDRPPPAAPSHAGAVSVALWSLRFRYWAWRVAAADPLPTPDVQVFALYHPDADGPAVPDSLGLSKGLMAIAHLYASRRAAGSNGVVLAHELLHTLGATDKYDPANDQPRVPDGLGDPRQDPRYPQAVAEVMAGRIALGPAQAVVPDGLGQVTVGPLTAHEIGWTK